MMAYEIFKRTGVRVEEPTLAITSHGSIVLNVAAGRLLAAAGVTAVLLLWDRNTNKFAIKAASKGDRNAYAVTLTPGRSSGSLRAMSFLNHVGWGAKHRVSLPATWNGKKKMLETILPSKFIGAGKRAVAEG
ncbi:MAG: hypothetical protein WBL63_02195 [Candidatus Acidiferrum sp.]